MTAADQPRLTKTEWSAVSVALQEANRCGCPVEALSDQQGLVARAAARLFGGRHPAPLANPRIEAIRRFVCVTRRQRRPADEHSAVLESLGFNRAQIDALGLLAH